MLMHVNNLFRMNNFYFFPGEIVFNDLCCNLGLVADQEKFCCSVWFSQVEQGSFCRFLRRKISAHHIDPDIHNGYNVLIPNSKIKNSKFQIEKKNSKI